MTRTTVTLRLWISNQDAIGSDADHTLAHLEAVGWTTDEYVTLPAELAALRTWFDAVFLPLQSAVAAAGWGDDVDADTPAPRLVVSHDKHWDDSTEVLMQLAAADGDDARWAAEVLAE